MAKRKKRRDWGKEIFAPNSKENFFRLTGPAARVFGTNDRKRRQKASLNISGAGSLDRSAPQIAGSGLASRDVPDLSGRKRDRRKRRVPGISGAGSRDQGIPSIGGSAAASRGVPSLGGRNKRRQERVPSIGAGGKASRDAPSLGGNAKGVPDISAAVGAGKRNRLKDVNLFIGRQVRSVAASVGGFSALSEAEQNEMDLFVRRASQAGYQVDRSQRLSWSADLMLGKYEAADLWKTDIGQGIERRYGTRGEDLDLPEADRPKRGFVPEDEEVREGGVRPSTRVIFQRIIKPVSGRLFRRSTFRRR